jgi:hypothetical protein
LSGTIATAPSFLGEDYFHPKSKEKSMPRFRSGMAAAAISILAAGPIFAQTDPAPPNPTHVRTAQAEVPSAPGVTPSQPAPRGSSPTAANTPPIAGANSFTESQAKNRIEKSGFSDVQGLKLDGEGVWRGQAKKAGQQVNVALDYRGNVVQQ